MKILMPYKARGNDSFESTVINGGLEKFAKQLYELIPGIIPITITAEDRKLKRTGQVIQNAIEEHKPDLAISNDLDYTMTGRFLDHGVPIINIIHSGLVRDIQLLNLGPHINDLITRGAHVYFVSNNQHEFYRAQAKRIKNVDLLPPAGIIPSSYVESSFPFSEDIVYDIGTVGRQAPEKDPFWVHRKFEKTDYKTCVVSCKHTTIKEGCYFDYAQKTNHYFESSPRDGIFTFDDLPHDQVLKIMSQYGVYVSTCPFESWGITAMESLGCGVPLLLLTNKTDNHSSMDIAASPEHYRIARKSSSLADLDSIISYYKKYTVQQRLDIAEQTKIKHSRENYVALLNNMINKRLDDKLETKYNSLCEFFI